MIILATPSTTETDSREKSEQRVASRAFKSTDVVRRSYGPNAYTEMDISAPKVVSHQEYDHNGQRIITDKNDIWRGYPAHKNELEIMRELMNSNLHDPQSKNSASAEYMREHMSKLRARLNPIITNLYEASEVARNHLRLLANDPQYSAAAASDFSNDTTDSAGDYRSHARNMIKVWRRVKELYDEISPVIAWYERLDEEEKKTAE